ncbi:MAG: tetratricopeptide (TPR) repeat protein [Colwellia sp.]|jgi:tetratricopeptide (TPR) repeat protein
MNTKIYKHVHSLAKDLMQAVHRKNQIRFDECYAELQKVCDDNIDTDKDHPVQWETLADFTDDLALAITIYEKALQKAEAINSKDFLSSVAFAIASLQVELGDKPSAIEHLKNAKINSNKIADKDLKAEIEALLEELGEVAEVAEIAEVPATEVAAPVKLKAWKDIQ